MPIIIACIISINILHQEMNKYPFLTWWSNLAASFQGYTFSLSTKLTPLNTLHTKHQGMKYEQI